MDLYRYDAKTYARTLFFQNDEGYDLGAVSPDGKWLSLERSRTTSDSDVSLYGIATKELKQLTPHQAFSPNGTWRITGLNEHGRTLLRVLPQAGEEGASVAPEFEFRTFSGPTSAAHRERSSLPRGKAGVFRVSMEHDGSQKIPQRRLLTEWR
ncbi:hypothetical protein [Cystobacter fuscus]|uniref:hypothetical protein n=1 Tax=Cystobacter fuscus TaxID=43 RepID=UPI0037BF336A